MFKNVVLLSLKLAMTTAHDRTVSADGLHGQMMMTQSQELWVITHIWPQEPPTAPKAVSADHRAACMVEATATLNARSDGPRAAVAAWYGYTTTPRIQIALKAARLSYFATHVTHVKTGEKELHGSAGKQSGAVRGPLCFSR